MSEPLTPGAAPDEPEERAEDHGAGTPATAPAPRRGPFRLLARGRRSRWVVGGVAGLVLVGGTAAVTAALVHHGDERGVRAVAVGPEGLPGLKRLMAEGGPGGGAVVVEGGQAVKVPGGLVGGDQTLPQQLPVPGADGAKLAPAPLPSLPADQAVTKAVAAVTGGKVESLASVPEQGGGSAWLATVLGPDGVRHLVTLDGATGTITSNTVLGG
ncbi:hypothetical protein ABIA32_006621 [Streptacidiphilus sp. MAP12-20]|uniref:PepSY domain-containing protein n=1 Tax=Streptacidiphilus sp. MAP12-20 TaxID=3156299 RepID=UPI0035144003